MNLTSAEIEFISEFEMVDTVPLEPIPLLKTIHGTWGPFKPPLKCQMPLWIAKFLLKKGKIQISPLSQDLEGKLEEEKSLASFSALDFYWMEKSKFTSESALIQDIWEIRERKIQAGLDSLDAHYLQVIFTTIKSRWII